MNLNSLLKNQNFLYVIVALASLSMLGYISSGNINALVSFIIVGLITSYFTKNLIIILSVALLATNITYGGKKIEGMENHEPEQGNECLAKCDEAHKDIESEEYKQCAGACGKDIVKIE